MRYSVNIFTVLFAAILLPLTSLYRPTSLLQESDQQTSDQQTSDLRQNRQTPTGRDDNAALYMQAKLSNAQKVLEGLVSRDFGSIEKGARQMKKISEAAHWPTTIDEVYQHYSFEFRRQCDKLVEQAQTEDLRAAHFTYLHMSTTCIDCHDYVRPRFKVEKAPKGPVRLIPTDWNGRTRHLRRPSPDDSDQNSTPKNSKTRNGTWRKPISYYSPQIYPTATRMRSGKAANSR